MATRHHPVRPFESPQRRNELPRFWFLQQPIVFKCARQVFRLRLEAAKFASRKSKIRPMSFNQCRFCDRLCPADAKFCSACGGALHLMPCPRCGAVSDITATVCYECHERLPGRATDTSEAAPAATGVVTQATPPLPASSDTTSVSHLPALLILGVTGVVALIGLTGYYQRLYPAGEETRPMSVGSRTSGRATPSTTDPKAGAATATPQYVSEESETRPAAPKPPCTEGIAALDLCEMRPAQPRQADASLQAPKSSSRISGAETGTPDPPQAAKSSSRVTGTEAGTQGPPRGECTQAVTALGLCTAEPTPRKN